MTIIQLEYLLAVANCGSFSQASEQCFVTQPSLSMQIKNLEEELGVILLDRSKKPVIPTEVGEVVIRNAKEISGSLRLGVIPTISPYLLHKFIPEFLKRYPKVDVNVQEMETADICKALEKDMLDVAIIASGTTPEGIMEFEMFNDRFFAYVSPLNPLYERSNIRIEDIDPKQLVLLSQGHCLRDQVAELCQTRRISSIRHNFEGGSLETLMHLVDCTNYITVIPEMAVEFVPAERKEQIKTLAKGAASRKIALAVRRTYVKHSIIEALRSTIIDMVRNK